MKKLVTILLIVAFIQGCDPYSRGYICNDTNGNIELTLKFTYDSTHQMTKGEYRSWFQDQIDSNTVQLSLDTVNMTGVYMIESQKCALVGHGMSGYPPLWFNYLQLRTQNDTLTYSNIDVPKTFTKRGGTKIGLGGDFELRITK